MSQKLSEGMLWEVGGKVFEAKLVLMKCICHNTRLNNNDSLALLKCLVLPSFHLQGNTPWTSPL